MCGGWLRSSCLLSRGQLRPRQRVSLLHTATHVSGIWHVTVSLADMASVAHSVLQYLLIKHSCLGAPCARRGARRGGGSGRAAHGRGAGARAHGARQAGTAQSLCAALLWLGSAECAFVSQWLRRLYTLCKSGSMSHKENKKNARVKASLSSQCMPCPAEPSSSA